MKRILLLFSLLAASSCVFAQSQAACGNVTSFVSTSIAGTGNTQLIAAPTVATAKIRICSFTIQLSQPASPANFAFTTGTGTNCGTGNAALTPTYFGAASTVQIMQQNYPDGLVFTAPAGKAVCLNLSAAPTGSVVHILYTLSQGY